MNVKADREAAGISQAELARRIGMHQPKLSRIENGHIDPTVGEEGLIRAAIGAIGFLAEARDFVEEDEPAPAPHCQTYPAAPKDITARQAWVTQRNRNMQTAGVPAPASGTYGAPPKKPKGS